MRNKLLLSSMLLCAMWLVAQTYPNSSPSQSPGSGQTSPSSQTSSQSSDAGNETTVRGCLSGSSGNYTLTSDSGTTYSITGDTSKLSDHVGHEVEIKGTTSPSSSSSSGGAAGATGPSSGGAAQQTLSMTGMKHISSTCTSK